MSVLWIPIYVPMEFVKTYVVVTVVIATVAMNQMRLGETVLVSYLLYLCRSPSHSFNPMDCRTNQNTNKFLKL